MRGAMASGTAQSLCDTGHLSPQLPSTSPPLHPQGCADCGAQYFQSHHREYAMARSSITLTGWSQRLQSLWLPLRALYLARPGLITKLLAIIAFFSIGIV
jgi:hypothetical protein